MWAKESGFMSLTSLIDSCLLGGSLSDAGVPGMNARLEDRAIFFVVDRNQWPTQ